MNKEEGLKGPKSSEINWASRVLTRKNAPPPGSHLYFQPIITIFEPIQDIIETYILAKFYEDWNINVASTDIHETNVLSKFHENWAKNVTSSVFTFSHNIHIEKNAIPTGGHVFSPIPTIFKLL
ncbi:hypothetical protein DPMN_141170 [Dreissena polymorpha]|uniref:Uncharacterized protein n=1 Tax=Dreissena polymorpha TaxID=45954 RepID=A0A9D4GEX2_DREPO|nr:hypothetical protein DPMN_141170 [Dreissena polymorpha]